MPISGPGCALHPPHVTAVIRVYNPSGWYDNSHCTGRSPEAGRGYKSLAQRYKVNKWQSLEFDLHLLPLTPSDAFQDPSEGFSRNCAHHNGKTKVQSYVIGMKVQAS